MLRFSCDLARPQQQQQTQQNIGELNETIVALFEAPNSVVAAMNIDDHHSDVLSTTIDHSNDDKVISENRRMIYECPCVAYEKFAPFIGCHCSCIIFRT